MSSGKIEGSINYRPLSMPHREIRLLRVDKTSGAEEEYLQCSLVHTMLNFDVEHLPYAAASYCWGSDRSQALIYLDNQKVWVPNSAASTLRVLARKPGEHIWIDAICINQQDDVEKSWQVAMMKDIYTQANQVRIRLGSLENEIAISAIIATHRIYQQCLQETNDLVDLDRHLYGTLEKKAFTYSDAPLPAGCDWDSLRKLYSFPWFTRLWIVQEVALAHDGICYIDEQEIDAKIVTLAARWMVHRNYPKYTGGSQVEGVENASSMYRPSLRPLSNQLRRMHRQRCYDPRDRVYGLLGLLNPSTAAAINPDYSSPLVDVYACAIRAAIVEDHSLDILQFSSWFVEAPSANHGNPGWPSWVLKLHSGTESAHGSCLNVQVFGESDCPLQTRDLRDNLVLSVKGLCLASVTYASQPFTTELLQNSDKLSCAILECIEQASMDHIVSQGPTDPDDLKLSFICGINKHNCDAELDESLESQFTAFVEWCKACAAGTAGLQKVWPQYASHMWRSHNRRFFVTADGGIGMGPWGIRVGDRVCMLSGTAAVFVLRHIGEQRWKLIGDAYYPKRMKASLLYYR